MKFGKQPTPVADINEDDFEVNKAKTEAAGVNAVVVALERAVAQAGVTRTAQSLLRLNQRGGFDCEVRCRPVTALLPRLGTACNGRLCLRLVLRVPCSVRRHTRGGFSFGERRVAPSVPAPMLILGLPMD